MLAIAVSFGGGCSSTSTPGASDASSGSSPSSGSGGSDAASVSSGSSSSSSSGGGSSGAAGSSSSSPGSSSGVAGSSGGASSGPSGQDASGLSDANGGPLDAADDGQSSGGGSDAATSPEASVGFSQWVEAEAVPPNVLVNGANAVPCAGSAQYGRGANCSVSSLKEGALCCSSGTVVVNLLGRAANNSGAGVQFHNVTVPSDGMYDVTWWYHCGANDHFGDNTCGGLHYPVGSSCRPHLIDVNNVPMTTTVAGAVAQFFHFPCYPGDWSIIHAATTALPLKAGNNVIFIHTPHDPVLDGVDLDVIHVTAAGGGTGQIVTPVVISN